MFTRTLITLVFTLALTTLLGCASSPEAVLNRAGLTGEQIYTAQTPHGLVVFQVSHDTITLTLLEKTFRGWRVVQRSAEANLSDGEAVTWHGSRMRREDDAREPLYAVWGTAPDPDVCLIKLDGRFGTEIADVHEANGYRIWYMLHEGNVGIPNVIGFSDTGQVLYSYRPLKE